MISWRMVERASRPLLGLEWVWVGSLLDHVLLQYIPVKLDLRIMNYLTIFGSYHPH